MIGNPNQQQDLFLAAGLAVLFGMSAEIAIAGQLTWRWPVWASLFLIGFLYSYFGGFKK